MTPRLVFQLLSALQLFHQGRIQAGVEALTTVIREHGGCVPAGPVIEGPKPAPQPETPIWMRPGA